MLWALLAFADADAGARDGVGDTQILLGQSAALSGPSGELGKLFLEGARSYFDKINAQGGVHGRKIRLLSLDDQYEPDKTVVNTLQLIHQEKVFALFGYVGTATVAAAMPLIEGAGVPLFAPMSGARFLREPFNALVFNVRASYARETDYLLRQLQGNGHRNIAVFYQNDEFGKSTLELLRGRVDRYGLKLVGAVAVERNSEDARTAAKALLAMGPEVVILVASYPSAAALITRMRRAGYYGGFSNYSFVGSQSLSARLKHGGAGIVVTQVVPFPWKPHLPIVYEYQKAFGQAEGGQYSFVGLEGFIAARALVEGLRRAGRQLTREGLQRALETINPANYDGGGFPLRFSPGNHNGSDFVDLTAIGQDGRFIN
ncbi:ABC transporter substrate-binding protein [Herbaspirillum sp. LeCh32-8]|uniref:ABC transporter substrate-binding protein n=1 Tax=Herbaspirillum sp. LeCh32-8 TaxID=2821356 RepID=UPI001AE1D2F1|nr:ABC transporter substrate-binding protein [Herbaspirillum sp. LeCh32-8]MBP0597688.1 ABC transporter substrate-binding protein [Herbaspirillum sp. LeCh32-8]